MGICFHDGATVLLTDFVLFGLGERGWGGERVLVVSQIALCAGDIALCVLRWEERGLCLNGFICCGVYCELF